jgi:putative acetyltransferase
MSKFAFLIRPYVALDLPAIREMWERSIRELGPRAYSPEQVAAWAARTADMDRLGERLGDGRQVWVAEGVTEEPIGFIDLEMDGHIDFLYAAPEAAGQGVAARLYAEVERAANAAKISRLNTEASEVARGFFERMGFVMLHRRELELVGVPIHNWKMEKQLA